MKIKETETGYVFSFSVWVPIIYNAIHSLEPSLILSLGVKQAGAVTPEHVKGVG